MVRHGTAKKRRSGRPSTKMPKQLHKSVKIVRAISNIGVKEVYDKKLTPKQNLINFGLVPNVNKPSTKEPKAGKLAAFVGYAELPVPKKQKVLSDEDQAYALACIKKHGENYTAMHRDIITNFNQLTEHKLKKLCEKYLAESQMETA